MAESNRRGEGAADEDLDEVFDEAVDDDDADELVAGGGRTATRSRAKAEADSKADSKARIKKDDARVGIFGRIGRFVREVVAELRKVIWPNRNDLLTYATVVIVFVAVILTVVGALDYGFARLALLVFGNGKS